MPSIKYLGLTVTHDMKWNNHIINNTTAASNRTLGFAKRSLRVNLVEVKEQAYKALVRQKLEYCATCDMLYKIINGLVSTQLKDHLNYSVRNGKLIQLRTKTDYFMPHSQCKLNQFKLNQVFE